MAEPVELQLLSDTKLDGRPHGELLAYNPSIELLAVTSGPSILQVRRSDGQVVSRNIQRGERETVQAVRWKADGQFLAIGWSDGVVRLMGLENNKAVHQISVSGAGKAKITCIAWSRNHAGRRSPASQQAGDLQGILSRSTDEAPQLDLPRELAFLEVETALPKLSPLPASGGSGDDMFVFTTRTSLDFLFRPFSPEDSDKVDVMIVGTNDGSIHLSMYDSFVIGDFHYSPPAGSGLGSKLELANHASHSEVSTHTLLFRPSGEGPVRAVYLVPMDLTFLHSSPENLSLLATKTTTLQKLLRYIAQVQMHMAHEWQSTRELPGRFLNSINTTLAESGQYGEMTIGQALYHSVVTGHTFPEVHEWLVDQLSERGHKRWDKAVVTGLETLRSLVHENFLPALERISIILSRLLGLARFHDSKDEIGFSGAQITKAMDIVSCLMLVGNKVLLLAMEELDAFHTFSTWLRHEIDHQASSSATDELSEKEATLQHGKILAYIQRYLSDSPLRAYLSPVSKSDAEKDRQKVEDGPVLLELLDKEIKRQESGQPQASLYSQVDFLCSYLTDKANEVFNGIAGAHKRNVRFGQAVSIEMDQNISRLDAKMCAKRQPDGIEATTYTAISPEQQDHDVYIFRTITNVVNGISGTVTTQAAALSLGNGRVLDIKFLYEHHLLVLWNSEDKGLRVVRIPYQSPALAYTEYKPGTKVNPRVLRDDQVTGSLQNFVLPNNSGFMPTQMEVKKASSIRGYVPARICLLGDDLQTYQVYTIPDGLLKEDEDT